MQECRNAGMHAMQKKNHNKKKIACKIRVINVSYIAFSIIN